MQRFSCLCRYTQCQAFVADFFAEEHPNNIASAFAHVLMRVDDGQDEDEAATAINYTVQPNKADGVLVSTVKSASGGYPAVMEIMPYQKKRQMTIWSKTNEICGNLV